MSLKRRFLFTFSMIAVLPLCTAAFFSVIVFRNGMKKSLIQSSNNTVYMMSISMNQLFENIEESVIQIISMPAVTSYLQEQGDDFAVLYHQKKNLEEIQLSVSKIEKITGEKTKLYRTPYGEYNDKVIKVAQENGYYPIQWNLDTLDYKNLTGEEMWNRIKDKLSNGSIILSHNGTKNTANSLDMLIKNIKSKGYELVKVSELIYTDNYTIDNNGTQKKIQ